MIQTKDNKGPVVSDTDILHEVQMIELSKLIGNKYAHIVRRLTVDEFLGLKDSIAGEGIHIPIAINSEYVILDGYHRVKAARELNINKVPVLFKSFECELHEENFVIDTDLQRRQLNTYERCELIARRIRNDNEIEAARQRSLANLKTGNKFPTVSKDTIGNGKSEFGRTRDKVASKYHVKAMTFSRFKTIHESDNECVKNRCRSGEIPISLGSRMIISEEKQRKLKTMAAANVINLPNNDRLQLIHSDFRIISEKTIPDNSVDLIFTDPLYGLKDVPLYKDLGDLAMRVLKDDGSLVTVIGGHSITEICNLLTESGLKENSFFFVRHSGISAPIHAKKIIARGKLLLWFYKGSKLRDTGMYATNFIESEIPDKENNGRLAQATKEAGHIISKLTFENDIILDAMMGSVTTGIAALRQNRKFIGIDSDEKQYNLARNNLSKIVLEPQSSEYAET